MAVITIFRNPFSSEKEQKTITESMAVRDAIQFDPENSIVFINGFKRDGSWILQEDDICLIREFPSDPITFSAAIVAAVVIYYLVDKTVEYFTGTSIIDIMVDGVKKLLGFDGGSNATSDTESLKSIPQLRGAQNKSGLDKPVPFVFGKHLFTPYYCGAPYTFIDPTDGSEGENQYFCALYMIGYSNVKISDLKIGELTLASNVADVMNGSITVDGLFPVSTYSTQLEIQQANEVSLYTQKVIEEQKSAKLFCVAVEGGSGVDGSPPIRRWSASYPQKVQVEIMFPNGLYGNATTGDREDRTVQLIVKWRPINGGEGDWQSFPAFQNCTSSATGADGFIVSTFTKQVKKQMRYIAELSLTYAQAAALSTPNIEIFMERVNTQATDGRTADDVYWTITRTWCYDKTKSAAAGSFVAQSPVPDKLRNVTCRLGFRIKAANDISGNINSINMIVQSISRTWNGSEWSSMSDAITNKTTSSNPASVALLAMQQAYLGGDAYPDSKIDLVGMGAWYQFCADKGLSCDGVLTTQRVLREFLSAILFTGRAQFIRKDGKYSPFVDKPITSLPVTVLNQQNTSAATNSKNFDELPNGLRITFVDADDGYATNEIYVMYDGFSYTDEGMIFEDIDLPFVTNRAQVYKFGRYFLACKKLRPETWMRTVSVEGYDIPIGSLIAVQDDTIVVGSNEGGIITDIIQENNLLTEIVCDSYFDMLDGYSYGLKIVQANGIDSPVVRTVQVEAIQGYSNRFHVTTLVYMDESVIPTIGDIVAFGEYEKITIDAIVFGKAQKDDLSFELTLLPYVEDIYNADSGPIPEFDSKITAPLPTVLLELITESPIGLTGADGTSGADGKSIFSAIIFLQSSSAPSIPEGGSFDFSTGTLTPPAGWLASLPIATTTPTYCATFVFVATTPGATVIGGDWSQPVIFTAVGADGTSVRIKGSVATYSALPTTGREIGDVWIVNAANTTPPYAAGDGAAWSGTAWSNVGQIKGPKGDAGTTYYLYVRYSAYADGTSFGTSPNTFMGTCVSTSATAPIAKTAYTWVRAVGKDAFYAITNPAETSATHDNGIYGNYGGHVYVWTASTVSTGYWTLVPPDRALGVSLGMLFSFDEPIDNFDGSIIVIDNTGLGNIGTARSCTVATGRKGKALSMTGAGSYIGIY